MKYETLIQSLRDLIATPHPTDHAYRLIKFKRNSIRNVSSCEFIWKNSDVFFQGQHSLGRISRIVGTIDTKRKGTPSIRYWVKYITLTFDPIHVPDLEFFKFIFWNIYISGIVGLIDMKPKWIESIGYWDNYVTLPFDQTGDIDLEFQNL